jgi:hypothetical protein
MDKSAVMSLSNYGSINGHPKNKMNKTLDSFQDMPSLNEKVPVKYVAGDYPKFLQPHKHYPFRRLSDKHVE